MRRTLGMLLSLLTLALLLAAVPRADAAPSRAADYLVEARKYTNHERTSRRRPALVNSECLARFARAQAARMARDQRLYHTQDFGAIGRRCGLRSWAENVAQAPSNDTGREVVRMWMGSQGHRANILNAEYRHFGMGAVHSRGSWWVVQVFGRRA